MNMKNGKPLSEQPQWVQKYANAQYGFWDSLKGLWKDYTGQSAVDAQNAAQLELAKYQTQMQEEFYNKYSSPDALMRQYQEAGLNPNLVYGSASAGQSNVPSFSAPQVQRNISGADKINKALSLLSGISGVVTGIYQATAAKEAAQQAAIKTANDAVSYKRNAMDYIWDSDLKGISIGSPFKYKLQIPYVSTDAYARYLGDYRANQYNTWLRSRALNLYDFGHALNENGIFVRQSEFVPYYSTRNKQSWLKYDLMNELGNKGVYGKLAVSLLSTLF